MIQDNKNYVAFNHPATGEPLTGVLVSNIVDKQKDVYKISYIVNGSKREVMVGKQFVIKMNP